jgi:hypothetical protein
MKLHFLALLLSSGAQSVGAQPAASPQGQADERAVLAAVERFFAAVRDKDRAAILAAVLPDGLATAIRLDGGPTYRSWHWTTYVENALGAREAWSERLIAPEVRIERDIAMVWGRYELLADGNFSHCGVDHFDLVRRDGHWLVYNLTWTNQTQGCPGRR